jgi:hypothetical protein
MDDQLDLPAATPADPMPTVSVGETSAPAAEVASAGAVATTGSGLRIFALIVGGALLVAVLVLQIATLNRVGSNADDLVALSASVTELDLDVASVRDQANALGDQLDGIEVAAAGETSNAPAVPAQSVPEGSLPPFESTQNDPAVAAGMTLGEVSGTEYYSASTVSYPSSSDKARVWMVWAHWCPYCQQELPELSSFWEQSQSSFPNVELVSISTSRDDTRGNPLEPYLDELQLPFPVLVDDDLTLAGQLGTTAFPYWVVTDTEGTVLLRLSGAIPLEQVADIFTQLESLTAAT